MTFWANKRVLLTGHTGFKGSWLALWLRRLGADVWGLSLAPPTEPSLYVSADVGASVQSTIGDIRDAGVVRDALAAAKPHVVFHLAAQPLVRASYADPVGTYATNVLGTVHVLDAVRQQEGIRAVVCATTDKCYENREWAWGYRETDVLGGRDPYSSSKACSEIVAAAYRDSYLREQGVALATARAGNVIGGGDWAADRLVPDLMRAFALGQPAPIRNPEAVRPWQHVLEPLGGYLLLAERLCGGDMRYASAWNFGPDDGDAKPVDWVAHRLENAWGGGARCEVERRPDQPHEARYLKLDCSKAKADLRWRPMLTLSESLDWTVEWYKAFHRDPSTARELTEQQIDRYVQRADSRVLSQRPSAGS